MTPRERILAALNHEPPDHTPTDAWFHHQVVKKLLEHYGTEDFAEVKEDLGIVGWASAGVRIEFPEYERKKTPRPGGLSGEEAVWIDERTHENAWGVRHRLGEGDWYEEWVSGPLQHAQTVEDVEKYEFPTAEQIAEPENLSGQVREMKERDLFVRGGIPNPYKQAWMLRGMDNVLADYAINQDVLNAIYDNLYALYGEIALRLARAGVDMINVTGDIAMQDRIIMGPERWRQTDKPRMAELIRRCREASPKVHFFIHSDGDVTDLMDDLIEIGFDVINPVQPECMDPVEVKKKWGDKITIHGGVSLQRTLPFGTPDEVREEVEHLIRECGYNGGLVVFPSNVIQPDTSVENIIACFHAARDLDVRALAR